MRAIRALAAVFEELDLAKVPEAWILSVAAASGSLDTETFATGEVTRISEAIRDRGLTAVDVVRALEKRGFGQEAENLSADAAAAHFRRLSSDLSNPARRQSDQCAQ